MFVDGRLLLAVEGDVIIGFGSADFGLLEVGGEFGEKFEGFVGVQIAVDDPTGLIECELIDALTALFERSHFDSVRQFLVLFSRVEQAKAKKSIFCNDVCEEGL